MELVTLFLIALGLSMDAFAVSVTNGLCYHNIGRKQVFYTALTFGAFQAAMPILGYLVGQAFSGTISFLDHWIALVLLGFIGGKMIVEAIHNYKHPEEAPAEAQFTFRILMLQGIATSIDALAVGISFALMNTNIVAAAGFIGVVTFVCCLLGAYLGKKFGALVKEKAEILGGCILVLIGLKIFIEHMLG